MAENRNPEFDDEIKRRNLRPWTGAEPGGTTREFSADSKATLVASIGAVEPHAQSLARDRGIANLRALTIAAAVGAAVLTAVFAAVAWSTVPGHASPQVAAAGSTSSGSIPGQRSHRHDDLAPSNGFTSSNGPTYVATGGSH